MTPSRPRVLVNSLPKSGTHLLAQAVDLLGFPEHPDAQYGGGPPTDLPPFLNYREVREALAGQGQSTIPPETETIRVGSLTPCPVPVSSLRTWLGALPAGHFILGHVLHSPALGPLLAELDYRQVFILRDPRAVVASLLAFILDTGRMPRRHFLEADLRALAPGERLNFILAGGYAPRAGVQVVGFAAVYRAALEWRESDCLWLRYEDLVGERGGGSREAQRQAMERLAGHLGVAMDEAQLSELYNPAARTFRTGSIDGWRQALASAERDRLEAVCAPLCAEAGYEVAA